VANRVDGTFSALGTSPGLRLTGRFIVRLTGALVGRVVLERSTDESSWTPVNGGVFTAAGAFDGFEQAPTGASYRLRCVSYTSGSLDYSFAAAQYADDLEASLAGFMRPSDALGYRAGGTSGGGTTGFQPSGRIFSMLAPVSNTSATVERLASTNLPGGLFNRDGQRARVRAWGTTAATGNKKRVGLILGAASTISVLVSSTSGFWNIDADVCRTSTDVQEIFVRTQIDNTNGSMFAGVGNSDDAADIACVVLGFGDVASDVTVRGFTIEFLP
jgi:limonene-1,2-epoxide hydrolase